MKLTSFFVASLSTFSSIVLSLPGNAGELEIVESRAKVLNTCSIPNFKINEDKGKNDFLLGNWKDASGRIILLVRRNDSSKVRVLSLPKGCVRFEGADGFVVIPQN